MFLFYCRNLLVWHVFAPYLVFIQRLLITKIMSKLKKKKKGFYFPIVPAANK